MSEESLTPKVSPDNEIAFEVEAENWNVYDTSDKSIIKIRPIVLKIFSTTDQTTGRKGFALASQNLLVVSAPKELRGKPSAASISQDELARLEQVANSFTAKSEPWNIYRLEKETLKVKLVVTAVRRAVGHFDQFGQPLYVISSDNLTQTEKVH